MLRLLKNKQGQSVAEYVIILGLVVATVIAMQTYVKRGVQGRIRDAVDYVDNAGGAGVVSFTGSQYEPYYLKSDIRSQQKTTGEKETYSTGGSVDRVLTSEETETTGTKTYELGTAENE